MDRRVFFDRIRPSLFKGGLKQGQVDGINAVLDEWEKRALTDLRWLAYMLATDYHETARTMQAIEEWGKGKGKAYGKKDPKTGKAYYGRGLVQLTWAANYKKMGKALGLPLYENPELALRPDIAVQILFEGMTEAKSTVCDFTGKCLSDYFTASKTDWVGARRIVDGTDRAAMVAGYARKFHDALVAAAEPFKSPEALKRSRIVKSASGAAVGGASTAGFNGVGLYDAATKAEGHVSTGSLVGMAIGAAVMCFALYALYARWDDAGRPSLRQVFRGFDAEPEE